MRQALGLNKLGFSDRVNVNSSNNELVNESSDGTRCFRLDPPKRDTGLYPDSWMRYRGFDGGYMVNHFRGKTEAEARLQLPPCVLTPAVTSENTTGVGLKRRPSLTLQTVAHPEDAPQRHEPATQLAGSTPAVAWYRKNADYQQLTSFTTAQGASLWSTSQQPKATGTSDPAQVRPSLWNPRHVIASSGVGNSSQNSLGGTPTGQDISTVVPTGSLNPVEETYSVSKGFCALITESESSVQGPPPATLNVPNASSPPTQDQQRALMELHEEGGMPCIGRVEVQVQGFPEDLQKTSSLGKYQPICCDENELKKIWLKIMMEDPAVKVGEDILAERWLEGAATEPSVGNALTGPAQVDAISLC